MLNVLEAIKSRRSIGVVKPEEPPRELIEQILEAATWAPNHHRTEPWLFFVLTGKARERLGMAMAEISIGSLSPQEQSGPEAEQRREKELKKPLRAPVVIAVAVNPATADNIEEVEEMEAVACSVQNMLLTAHALGLGAIWRTGKICYHPQLKTFFGLTGKQQLLGFVYIGYPAMEPRPAVRTPYQEKTVWMSE